MENKISSRGFTLVEVLIVVAILSVVAAIAVPIYKDYVKRSQLAAMRGYADEIALWLETYHSSNSQGLWCPDCGTAGTYVYTYREDSSGNVVSDNLTNNYLTHFNPSARGGSPHPYAYQLTICDQGNGTITVTGIPANNGPNLSLTQTFE